MYANQNKCEQRTRVRYRCAKRGPALANRSEGLISEENPSKSHLQDQLHGSAAKMRFFAQ